MTRIGTVADARAAIAGDLTYIGEGCYRQVYCDYETSTVYKVEYEDGIEFKANKVEYGTYRNRQFLNLPTGFRITPMRLIIVDSIPVIAARFINGTRMGECFCVPGLFEPDHANVCLPDDINDKLIFAGIDTAWGNIIYDGDTYWIVDAQ